METKLTEVMNRFNQGIDLSVDQTALLLGCSRQTIYRMIQRQDIDVFYLGKLTRIPNHSIKALRTGGPLRKSVQSNPK